jgi:hypothetical protein
MLISTHKFLAFFPRSEERADQRSVVGVSNRRTALVQISLHEDSPDHR